MSREKTASPSKASKSTPDMRNFWYPVSFGKDIKMGHDRTKPTGFHLLGKPLVLFRSPDDGKVHCLEDICAHRSAALSQGKVMDGKLECPYHGWQYDGPTGKVTHIPALLPNSRIPGNAYSKRLPTVELDGLVWVWPGRPEDADESKIFRDPMLGQGGWSTQELTMDLDIDASLMNENLMDPSHVPFTHEGTIQKRKDATPLRMEVEEREDGVLIGRMERPLKPGTPDSFFEFHPPSLIVLRMSIRPGWQIVQVIWNVPMAKGNMKMFYRFHRNWLTWLDYVPGFKSRMDRNSRQIVLQDYELLHGQQERLRANAKAWNSPIQVDQMPKAYRRWLRKALARDPWFKGWREGELDDIEDIGDGSVCSSCNVASDAKTGKYTADGSKTYNIGDLTALAPSFKWVLLSTLVLLGSVAAAKRGLPGALPDLPFLR